MGFPYNGFTFSLYLDYLLESKLIGKCKPMFLINPLRVVHDALISVEWRTGHRTAISPDLSFYALTSTSIITQTYLDVLITIRALLLVKPTKSVHGFVKRNVWTLTAIGQTQHLMLEMTTNVRWASHVLLDFEKVFVSKQYWCKFANVQKWLTLGRSCWKPQPIWHKCLGQTPWTFL